VIWIGDVDALLGEVREFLTGERAAPEYSGIAVHLGARVASAAEPGQVLVTSTGKDLVVGSHIRFEDLGSRTLKVVPDEWRPYRLVS